MPATDTLGVAAALAVALCWAVSAIAFSAASRRIGQFHVNQIRLILGSLLLFAACVALDKLEDLPGGQLALLGASGVVGLALGDAALFLALQILGPRRASLIMALAPGVTALLAPSLLGEGFTLIGLAGMVVTLGGVAWVIMERAAPGEIEGSALLGGAMGLLGAVGQAVGLILSKAGLGVAHGSGLLFRLAGITPETAVAVSPLYGTLVRTLAALAVLSAYAALTGRPRKSLEAAKDLGALRIIAIGATFGPFLGVTLSLFAVAWTTTYVAATIMATQPIVVIPMVRFLYGQRPSLRALGGAVLAVVGVAVLSLRGEIAELF